MGTIIRIAKIIVEIIGFIIAEVIPFGRAIQKMFKTPDDGKK